MFEKADFENPETRTKLVVIVNDLVGNHPLLSFDKLSEKQRKVFNKELNSYIDGLPKDGYLEVMTEQYETILTDKVFTENFNAENFCPSNVSTELEQI